MVSIYEFFGKLIIYRFLGFIWKISIEKVKMRLKICVLIVIEMRLMFGFVWGFLRIVSFYCILVLGLLFLSWFCVFFVFRSLLRFGFFN